ncbi:alpha/beta hydrolase [Mycobacterium sp.]|uniref:alpha/beta hydrolase n=1 Tax=Mycobacterium sp. TaxID=1785 RepID=UPI003BA8DA4D
MRNQSLAVVWDGAGGDGLRERTRADLTSVSAKADQLRQASKIARDGAGTIGSVQRRVLYAVEDAHDAGFVVGEDLSVVDTWSGGTAAEQVARRAQAQAFAADIRQRATQLIGSEHDVAAKITTATAGIAPTFPETPTTPPHPMITATDYKTSPPGHGTGEEPGGPQDPKEFSRWWNSLTEEQKDQAYARDHGIGNHPGMPFDDKTRFNEKHLDELTRDTTARVEALQHRYDELAAAQYMGDPDAATAGQLADMRSQLQSAQRSLNQYRHVGDALQPQGGVKRYLGLLDEHGHAAISVGDPDTAARNATFVPGTGDDLTHITDATKHAQDMYFAALRASNGDLDGRLAVTTWMGYDRPMDLVDAAFPDPARNGAGAFDAFQDGMRASHQGAASIDTIIGHSYGSTLVGAAATEGHQLAADNVIAVASPGMLTDHAADLALNPGAHVYSLLAGNDPIGHLPQQILGANPASTGFGAIDLQAGPGPAGPWYELGLSGGAHSSYWDKGNRALDNMGAIIAGLHPPHPMP